MVNPDEIILLKKYFDQEMKDFKADFKNDVD
jgi:hypothetical protein